MYISPKLKWLKPYIDLVKPVVPELRYLKKILAHNAKSDLTQNPGFEGKLTKNSPKDYVMSIYMDYVRKHKIHPVAEFSIKANSKIELLYVIAHEIAHLRHWNHTPERQILESTIVILFMAELKKSGYKSEEEDEGISY